MADPASEQRREVLISGQVQGVGFRYTTCSVARRFAVTGFVRNLADGRVQIVAEGSPDQLDQFLAAVHDRMSELIRDMQSENSAAKGDFSEFRIQI